MVMELPYPSFTLLLLTLLLFLLMLIKDSRNKSRTHHPDATRLPPGPWKLPIIGSLHHLLAGGQPQYVLRDLAGKHGPVMLLKLGQVDLVVISSPEAAQEVTKTHDLNFATRPEILVIKLMYGQNGVAFAPYGAHWRQMRKICVQELLSTTRIRLFSSIREEETSNLVTNIAMVATGSPINLTKMLLPWANMITARAAFGKGCRQQQRFISALMECIRFSSGFDIADLFPSLTFIETLTGVRSKLKNILHRLDEVLDEIIEDHQVKESHGSDAEDLVDVLLRIKNSGDLEIPLTRINIKSVIYEIFSAGTETTSSTVEWAMSELMRNPIVMEKVQVEVRSVLKGKTKVDERDINEMHYLKLVIKETLRLCPPVPLLVPRLCDKMCEVGGFMIPAGSRVVINAWAMARDPRIWDDAESFKPERFIGSSINFNGNNCHYLPFGAGRRICPGITFGMAGVEYILAQLLYHFNWELPNGMKPEDLDMVETSGAAVRRKNDLCLIANPYTR